jgi:hypothetical protein
LSAGTKHRTLSAIIFTDMGGYSLTSVLSADF